jgi:cytoskeleton protein RodZ
MTSIGETLRRERIKRKLDLEGVSHELKISPRFLEAIEDEDFDKLPGRLFTRSFVRQYARLLGLDEDEIAGELKRVLEPQSSAPFSSSTVPSVVPQREAEIPLPRVESWTSVGDKPSRWVKSLPALAMVVAVMLVCSLAYSWLQRPRRAIVAQPPPKAQPAPKAPATETARATTPKQPAPVAPSENPTTANTAQSQSAERGSAAPPSAAVAPVGSVASQSAGNPNAPVRVEMTADDPVWVSVKADGKYLFSGTLQPNETKAAGANENITIRLGNAGGIRISLNGKPIGPVGPKGQVRTVQLTSGGFQILVPEVSKPTPPRIDVLDPL